MSVLVTLLSIFKIHSYNKLPNYKELSMKRLLLLLALCLSLSASSTILDVEQRGCCSHHGGVAGCSNGRIVCNDGSYSPTCTCKGDAGLDSACANTEKNATKS
jgi:hypothetical protein